MVQCTAFSIREMYVVSSQRSLAARREHPLTNHYPIDIVVARNVKFPVGQLLPTAPHLGKLLSQGFDSLLYLG